MGLDMSDEEAILTKVSTDFSVNQYIQNHHEFSQDNYGSYNHLKYLLKKYTKSSDNVLLIGPDGSIGHWLFLNDIKDITIMVKDESQIAQQDKKSFELNTNEMKTIISDFMDYETMDQKFSNIIDKIGIDQVYYNNFADSKDKIKSLIYHRLDKVAQLLKNFGRFIFLSHLSSYMIEIILNWFKDESDLSWIVRVHRCNKIEESMKSGQGKIVLPVFAIVAIKLPTSKEKLLVESTFSLTESNKDTPKRYSSSDNNLDQINDIIESLHKLAAISNYLRYNNLNNNKEVNCQMFYCSDYDHPRYTITITDCPRTAKTVQDYAIFIAPEGRETEWIFGSTEGRLSLCQTSKCSRLAVVHLGRHHQFHGGLEKIKTELSPIVMYFAQDRVVKNFGDKKISFLSVGDDMGTRTIVSKGTSQMSGDYLIEDVIVGSDCYRRLIFMSSQNIIQSEAKLKKQSRQQKELKIDPNYVSCQHHCAFLTGISIYQQLTSHQGNHKMCLIGLGGGCFLNFLQSNVRLKGPVEIDVIDIDPIMETISKDWFGLKLDNQSTVKSNIIIEDGLDFIRKASECQKESYHVIILDVNSSDQLGGLSCPPEPFVEERFLKQINKVLDKSSSMFMVNLVTRSNDRRIEIEKRLKKYFNCIYSVKVPEDVNVIYWCFKSSSSAVDLIITSLSGSTRRKTVTDLVGSILQHKSLVDQIVDADKLASYITKL